LPLKLLLHCCYKIQLSTLVSGSKVNQDQKAGSTYIALLHHLQALTGLCEDLEAVAALALPPHWARHFFLASLCLELQHNAEALSRLQVINQVDVLPTKLPNTVQNIQLDVCCK
jgi:hypothetical protein